MPAKGGCRMSNKIRDGDIYKVAVVADRKFEIRYGYSTEAESEMWEPAPVYPDFLSQPEYTPDGIPFATAFQDACEYFAVKQCSNGEGWCDNCIHFDKREDYIGLCRAEERKLE